MPSSQSRPALPQTGPRRCLDDLLNRPLALVVALALVGLLPFLLMTLTSFVKISTVLHIVRGAIGAPEVPSSTVVVALAGALTFLAMAPVATRIADRVTPLLEPAATMTASRVGSTTRSPPCVSRSGGFCRLTRRRNKKKTSSSSRKRHDPRATRPRSVATISRVVIPAFLVTELIEAFALGFAIYLPFLVVDLVVANVLAALGMQTLSPTQVSLPFKLLLFVAADGWGLLARALVTGYLAAGDGVSPDRWSVRLTAVVRTPLT